MTTSYYARHMALFTVTFSCIVSGCSRNLGEPIIPELTTGNPVCLSVDWHSAPAPSYSGRPAPDTVLLLPQHGGRHRPSDNAESWGDVALSPSQRDRQGAGWSWWTVGDTLVIRGWSVTEEDLILQAVKPHGSIQASWLSQAMGTGARRGTATMLSYKCQAPANP